MSQFQLLKILGKLMPGADVSRAYTPSFNLLGHESLIMQQSDIASISDAIKDCLKCLRSVRRSLPRAIMARFGWRRGRKVFFIFAKAGSGV